MNYRTYGENEKKIVFADTDDRHAKLLIRLRHDGLTQKQFFQYLISCYINKDIRMVDMIDSYKYELAKQGKKKIKETRKLIDDGIENEKSYILSEKDKDDIFDMLETEIGDL
jgi:hypothetical protein